MAAKKEKVWRSVDGEAILCSVCANNYKNVLREDGQIIGITYTCTAENEICEFLHKKIDGQETYATWQEIVKPEDQPDDPGEGM